MSTGQPPNRRPENRKLSFFPIFYNSSRQLRLQLQSTTPLYNSALQSQLPLTAEDPPTTSTITTTTAVFQECCRLLRISPPTELRTPRSIIPRMLILYKNTSPPQPLLLHIIFKKDNVISLTMEISRQCPFTVQDS